MLFKDKKPEAEHRTPVQAASGNQSDEATGDVEMGQPGAETEESDRGETGYRPKKRRSVWRWIVLLLIAGLALSGYLQWERLKDLWRTSGQSAQSGGRQLEVLYWVDPMHPAYKSDKPGKAPDCGMDLVPVYAEETTALRTDLPEGTIHITAEKQQLIGVQYGTAEFKAVNKTLRAVGRLTWSGESRHWRVTDIKSIGRSGPYQFGITTYEPQFGGPSKAYNFDLKERMDDAQYDYLWARVYRSTFQAGPETQL